MVVGVSTGVDGANRAAGDDPGGSFRVTEGQMQGTCDVVPGPRRDNGQNGIGAGTEVDPEVDRAVAAGDCQDVQTRGDTG